LPPPVYRPLRQALPYLAAIALAVGAWLVRLPMESALGAQYVFITFFPAAALAAFLLGFWPGILCALICAVLADLLVIPPYGVFLHEDPEPLAALTFFVVSCTFLSAIGSLARRARGTRQALHLSEQRLSLLTDATPALISHIDRDLRYRFINAQYEKWFALKRDDILGRTMTEVLGAEALACLQPYVDRVLAGQDVHFEAEIPYRGGGTRWIDAHYVPEFDASRKVSGFCVLVLDISNRKHAENMIRIREEEFRTLFELSAVGKAQADPITGRLLRVNQCLCEISGRTEQDLLAMSYRDLTHPHDREREAVIVDPVLRGEADRWEIEKRYCRPDGQIVWVHVFGRMVRDAQGQPARTLAAIVDITARKRAEDELRRSEEQLAAAHEAVSERQQRLQIALAASETGTFRWDPASGRFLEFDENLRILFAVSPGKPVRAVEDILPRLHPDDRDRFIAAINRSRAGDDLELEFRVMLPGGGVRWLYDRGKMERDADGKASYLVGACTDITHRKQVEETVRESEERFRTLADALPLIVWVHGPDGQQEFVNQTFCTFFGVTREDMRGGRWQALMHPDDAEAYTAEFIACVRDHRPFHAEVRVRHADGQWHWLESWATPRSSGSGEFLGYIGSSADVTERKNADQALRQSEERFRTLADAMPQLVWTAHPDGAVDYYNRRTCHFDGFQFHKDIGQWNWEPCVHPDDIETTRNAWAHAVATGDEYRCEHRIRMAPSEGGDYRWFLSRAVPVRDHSGTIIKWFGTATEIQAIKKAEEALRRANDDLLQFASIASHDLKEPLRGMSLLASFLERDEGSKLTAEGRERLARIRALGERLTGMVNSLLEHAQTGLKPTFEVCDLGELVQRVIDTSREDLAVRGCDVVVHGTLPTVYADRVLIERVFSNLIANGLKFNESPVKRVEIFADGNAVAVRDNGIGIDPRHHRTVFKIFRRIYNTDQYPGQGLGLAVTKKIIDAHGGTIKLESALGTGSTFRITLPPAPHSLSTAATIARDPVDGPALSAS
jgi:PAS domain S-box-containing protein